MSVLAAFVRNLPIINSKVLLSLAEASVSVRFVHKDKRTFVEKPEPGNAKSFRRIVHYPEKYTVTPLNTTNLGGRDPVTGRRVVKTLGGGIKHKYHWIKWQRDGPSEGPPQEEKVLKILKCGCRTAHVALVAVQDQLKYILATENMKPGDILRTSKFIPRIPVTPNEGDAYPLGALPPGTNVHNVQLHPSNEITMVHSAGCYATIKKKLNKKVIVQLPNKREMAFEPECMATVGRLSNVEHSSIPIGSPQKLRELGYRPRSGLRQKKTGRFGRKIKRMTSTLYYTPKAPPREEISELEKKNNNPWRLGLLLEGNSCQPFCTAEPYSELALTHEVCRATNFKKKNTQIRYDAVDEHKLFHFL